MKESSAAQKLEAPLSPGIRPVRIELNSVLQSMPEIPTDTIIPNDKAFGSYTVSIVEPGSPYAPAVFTVRGTKSDRVVAIFPSAIKAVVWEPVK
jgi:hypothetical protein